MCLRLGEYLPDMKFIEYPCTCLIENVASLAYEHRRMSIAFPPNPQNMGFESGMSIPGHPGMQIQLYLVS